MTFAAVGRSWESTTEIIFRLTRAAFASGDIIAEIGRVEAQLPVRYLQDMFLPSYAGGINADADTVMVDSGSVNNVPATASHFLLTTELRERLGFKGVVISDYGDVPALASAYHVAADFPGAIAKAVNAGVDVSMTPFDYAG